MDADVPADDCARNFFPLASTFDTSVCMSREMERNARYGCLAWIRQFVGDTKKKAFRFAPERLVRRGWDSNPRYPGGYNGFRDRPIQPLWHPS